MKNYIFLTDDTRSIPKNYYKGEIGVGEEVPIGSKERMGKLTTVPTVHFIRNKFHSWVPLSELQEAPDSSTVSSATPTSSDPVQQQKDKESFEQGKTIVDISVLTAASAKRMQALAILGTVAGLGYAYKKGSSVGGYFGWAILFSFIGILVALASVKIIPPDKK
jgi:hypothetical protein